MDDFLQYACINKPNGPLILQCMYNRTSIILTSKKSQLLLPEHPFTSYITACWCNCAYQIKYCSFPKFLHKIDKFFVNYGNFLNKTSWMYLLPPRLFLIITIITINNRRNFIRAKISAYKIILRNRQGNLHMKHYICRSIHLHLPVVFVTTYLSWQHRPTDSNRKLFQAIFDKLFPTSIVLQSVRLLSYFFKLTGCNPQLAVSISTCYLPNWGHLVASIRSRWRDTTELTKRSSSLQLTKNIR